MSTPSPTPIFRIIHIDNLQIYLRRNALHAPLTTPDDGLVYRAVHNLDIQQRRRREQIYCGGTLKGCIHDYVSFYFGFLSPMLYQLHTGWVPGYNDGQDPIINLVTTCQEIERRGLNYVFSDGHGIANFTLWFDDLSQLGKVDWTMVYKRYWNDTDQDPDRQRRKQAEFLIRESCPWDAIIEIGVINQALKTRVQEMLGRFPRRHQPVVKVHKDWYYQK